MDGKYGGGAIGRADARSADSSAQPTTTRLQHEGLTFEFRRLTDRYRLLEEDEQRLLRRTRARYREILWLIEKHRKIVEMGMELCTEVQQQLLRRFKLEGELNGQYAERSYTHNSLDRRNKLAIQLYHNAKKLHDLAKEKEKLSTEERELQGRQKTHE